MTDHLDPSELTDPHDLAITSADEDRLRALLHAAADDLEIDPEHDAHGAITRPPTRSRRTPRTVAAVAAAAIAVVTVGGVIWAAGGDDPTVVDPAGPGHSTPTVATTDLGPDTWRDGAGIWRLPDPASGLVIEQALMSRTGEPPWLVALDPGGDSSRFVAVSLLFVEQYQDPDPETLTRYSTVDDVDVSMNTSAGGEAAGLDWTAVRAREGRGGLAIISHGIEADEIHAFASDLAALIAREPGTISAEVAAQALQAATLPSGLTPSWAEDDAVGILHGRRSTTGLTLGVTRSLGPTILVVIDPPPAGAVTAHRIASVLTSHERKATTSDLLEPTSEIWSPGETANRLQGFTGDGTSITVSGSASREELTAVLRSLRATDEAAARQRLRDDGIALGTVVPAGPTTTMVPDAMASDGLVPDGHTSTTAPGRP
ncbi:MAG: hypothetical protein EKK62_00505 [Acidimicrobiia bacterium]|nr:MAG: hypothetical protein EKK62_00505 [Acidimicrobiia bacterium]